MAAVTSSRFVGRRMERALLERLVAASRAGQGQIVLLSGEAGIGKSRLLDEVTRSARANGHRVLVGGCVSMHEDAAPLAPIAEALRGLAADTPRVELDRLLGPARIALGGLLPGLVDDGGREPGAGLMYYPAQQRLYAQLVDLMTRLSRDAPLVLIIEDIHWADAATLELLSLLARNLRSAPFVLIASYRTDEADPDRRLTSFLAEIGRLAHPEHIALSRFTRGEAAEQVAAIRGNGVALDRVEDVFVRSQGNPFYIEELLAAGDATDEVPLTLQAVLEARLSTLSDDAQRIVAAAAVRGAESTEEQLAAVTQVDEVSLARALHELLDRKIFERRRVGGKEVLDFRHALLKSAAYQDALPTERRRLHLAYARTLEQEAGTANDSYMKAELARHWEAAGDLGRALPAAISAGSAAEAAFQPALANEQYERALRLIGTLPAGEQPTQLDLVGLLERAARSAAGIGSPRAIQHISRALELVDPARDPVGAGLLYERLGRYRWYVADGDGALAAYFEAVRLVPPQPPSAERARVVAGLAQLLMILARFDDSMRYCREALAAALAVGDRAIEGHVTDTLGVNTAYLGDVDGGLELLWAAKAMAEGVGDFEEVGRVYANLVDVLLVAARYEEAADLGRESFAYQLEHGLNTAGFVLNYAAWALHLQARWPEALAALEQARQYPNYANSEVMNLSVSAMVEACRGETDVAQSHLDRARPLIAGAIDTQLLLPFAEAEAELALWTNRPAVALSAVIEGLERSEPLVGGNIKRYGPVYALGMRAGADLIAQPRVDSPKADAARHHAARFLAAMVDAHKTIQARYPVHLRLTEPFLALCRAEQTRIDQASDPQAWSTAADALSSLGRRHLVAYARWRQAEAALLSKGHAEDARGPLKDAYDIASSIGADPLRRAIEDLGRRARIGLAPPPPREPAGHAARFGLTAREIEVLRLLAAGKTNREIGEELFISGKTASVHVSNVLAKLGVARRSEAAAAAERIGLGSQNPAGLEGHP